MILPASRIARALALTVLCTAVLGLRVFTDITPIRAKLVRSPVQGHSRAGVDLDSNPASRGLAPPFAAIWRITHNGPSPAAFRLLLDERPVCERMVSPGRTRLDCAVDETHWAGGSVRQAVILGPAAGWSLDYLELATHHGGSTGIHRVFVLPAAAVVPRPSRGWVAFGGLLLGFLFFAPTAPLRRRAARRAHAVLSLVAVTGLLLTLAAPWATPFTVMLSPGGLGLGATVLALPALLHGARRLRSIQWSARSRVAIAGAAVVCVAAMLTARVMSRAIEEHDGNYSGLVHIDRARFDCHPALRERADIRAALLLESPGGYDGQFMYFAAFDPWLQVRPDRFLVTCDFIDAMPYRYGRIGFVWLTKLAALNQWQHYPRAMAWLAASGMVMTALVLVALARHAGVSPAWGLLALAIPGLWRSLHFALPEPIAAALLAGAFLCLARERVVGAAVLFAAAMLIRETVILAVAIACLFLFLQKRRGAAAGVFAAAVTPYVLWRLFVGFILYSDWGAEAFFFNPGVYAWPLQSIAEVYERLSAGTYHRSGDVARAALWFPPLLISAIALAGALALRHTHAVSVAALLYGLLALCLDTAKVWAHVANVERTTYETFVLLAIGTVMWGARDRRLRVALAVFWASCLVYLLFGAHDAAFTRRALFHQGPL
jgi:hypothetical protein